MAFWHGSRHRIGTTKIVLTLKQINKLECCSWGNRVGIKKATMKK